MASFFAPPSELDQQMEQEAIIAESALAEGGLKKKWMEELRRPKKERNLDINFQYAMLLTKSRSREDNKQGVAILKDLVTSGYHVEDCYYTMAMGLRRMGKYDDARLACEKVLRISPDHGAALRLHAVLRDDVQRRDVTVGVGAAAGAAVLGVVLAAVLARKR